MGNIVALLLLPSCADPVRLTGGRTRRVFSKAANRLRPQSVKRFVLECVDSHGKKRVTYVFVCLFFVALTDTFDNGGLVWMHFLQTI